jgi:peptidoglycan/LPS O-acetylase OafA/YrhL
LKINFNRVDEILDGQLSVYLDFVRGLSAILVVIEHLGSRLFVGYGNAIHQNNILVKLFYILHLLGGPAVIIFFVLSGLFISRTVLNAVYRDKWSWKSYLINRFSRLYTVLIPAIFLTFLLDKLGALLFQAPDRTNLNEMIGNLFFLQTIFVNSFGSNGPLWSLSYEFWYYMLFPLILFVFVHHKLKMKIIFLLISMLIFYMVGTKLSIYFFIWLIGTVILLLPNHQVFRIKAMVPISFLLVCVTMLFRPLVSTGRIFGGDANGVLFLVDIAIALTFAVLVLSLANVKTSKGNIPQPISTINKVAKTLASFSFSLYLIHYPIINLAYYGSLEIGYTGLQPSLLSVSIEVVLVIIICFFAYIFSKVTEARTGEIRNLLTNLVNILQRNTVITGKKGKNQSA